MLGRRITFNGWVIWVLDKHLPNGHFYHAGLEIDSITDGARGIAGMNKRDALFKEIVNIAGRK